MVGLGFLYLQFSQLSEVDSSKLKRCSFPLPSKTFRWTRKVFLYFAGFATQLQNPRNTHKRNKKSYPLLVSPWHIGKYFLGTDCGEDMESAQHRPQEAWMARSPNALYLFKERVSIRAALLTNIFTKTYLILNTSILFRKTQVGNSQCGFIMGLLFISKNTT